MKMAFTGEWVNQEAEINKIYEACNKLDFLVGMHYHSKAPENRLGDIILPTTVSRAWAVESCPEGTAPMEVPNFRTIRNFMVYMPKLGKLPGEARSRDWIYSQIGKKLGLGDKYCNKIVDTPWEQWDEKLDELAKEGYEAWAASDAVKNAVGTVPSWEEFKKKPWIEFPLPTSRTEYIPFQAQVEGGAPFATESGKIEIYSNYLADPEASTKDYYGGPIDPMPIWSPCWTNYFTKDEFNKYPLILFNPHTVHRRHNFYDANPLIGDLTTILSDPEHGGDVHGSTAVISAVDAKARGIKDGDMIRIFNDAGQVVLKAIVLQSLSPGVVQISSGRWADINKSGVDRRGGTNTLTYTRQSPSCAFPYHSPVQIEKY
jgi:anaerobic selenocysteine-containing dehydrogenase